MFKKHKRTILWSVAIFIVLLGITVIAAFDPFNNESEEEVVSFSVPNYAEYRAIIGELKNNYGFSEYQSYPTSPVNEFDSLSQFGQIAILVESSTLDELHESDYVDWGQECNYNDIDDYYISDGRLAITLYPTTEDPAFLQKCSAYAERNLKAYVVEAKQTETGILISCYRSSDMKVTLDIK